MELWLSDVAGVSRIHSQQDFAIFIDEAIGVDEVETGALAEVFPFLLRLLQFGGSGIPGSAVPFAENELTWCKTNTARI